MDRRNAESDHAARMAEHFEDMNAARYGVEWDQIPAPWRWLIVFGAACIGICAALLIGVAFLRFAIITAALVSDPFSGNPY
jgi:hypothetical protein